MASAMPDLWLPAQLQSITTVHIYAPKVHSICNRPLLVVEVTSVFSYLPSQFTHRAWYACHIFSLCCVLV